MASIVLSLCYLLLTFHLRLSFSGKTKSIESVPDLQKSMYKIVDGYPCVRILSLSGSIGCSNPGRDKVVAPIVRFEKANELLESSAILVSLDEFPSLFTRISNDLSFASKVGGVLVESGTDIQNKLEGFSPEQKFPQVEFAPYHNTSYEWNPIGSSIMWKSYNFPVFLLSDSSTKTLREAAIKNENKKKAYAANVAEFDLLMQTTRSGTPDSESCLKEGTCLPLGGYSVWSSLPPINTSSVDQSKPIILMIASMDSASFFRDKSLGADSPISGLLALLASVDALSHVDGLGGLSKQICHDTIQTFLAGSSLTPVQLVFVVFTGESWGYLGSRRFLLELEMRSDAVHGLNLSQIETIIELGSVGKGFSQGVKSFFAHRAGMWRIMPNLPMSKTLPVQVSSATNRTMDALKSAQDSLQSEKVKITSASASNPGIPPSSLMSFLKKNSVTSGVILEDFDTVFANKFYHSHLDDISNINSSAIAAAASLVARTLYILASDKEDVPDSALAAINANVLLIEELMGCLLNCDPGLSCGLVRNYISPASTCPSHYVGVIVDEPSYTPYPGYINDVPRFIWNFLADRTSIPRKNGSFGCKQNCKSSDEVCIKAENGEKGVCVISTTRYVPAYSTRLKFESGVWNVLPPNSSDKMGVVDPVWTESNWNTIGMQVYTVQDTAYDRLVLFGGIIVTILAYIVIELAKAFITKATKRD